MNKPNKEYAYATKRNLEFPTPVAEIRYADDKPWIYFQYQLYDPQKDEYYYKKDRFPLHLLVTDITQKQNFLSDFIRSWQDGMQGIHEKPLEDIKKLFSSGDW